MHPSSEVWETHRLTALLDEQHADLMESAVGLQQRQGSARLDLFLRFRRLTALHTLLDELVLQPMLAAHATGATRPPKLSALVSELEGHPAGSLASDWERIHALVAQHAHDCRQVARSVPARRLTSQQSRIVARACHLWSHEAEVVGSTVAEMMWILRDHLTHLETHLDTHLGVADELDTSRGPVPAVCMDAAGVGTSLVAGPAQRGVVR